MSFAKHFNGSASEAAQTSDTTAIRSLSGFESMSSKDMFSPNQDNQNQIKPPHLAM